MSELISSYLADSFIQPFNHSFIYYGKKAHQVGRKADRTSLYFTLPLESESEFEVSRRKAGPPPPPNFFPTSYHRFIPHSISRACVIRINFTLKQTDSYIQGGGGPSQHHPSTLWLVKAGEGRRIGASAQLGSASVGVQVLGFSCLLSCLVCSVLSLSLFFDERREYYREMMNTMLNMNALR